MIPVPNAESEEGSMRLQPTANAFVLLASMALAACSPEKPAPPAAAEEARTRAPRPAILLITLDTTRADALSLESGRGTTPNLDALAARGLCFSQALTTAPLTLPAHTSMMTGLYPAEHGIHENARYLGEDPPRLASRLQAAGYETAAFVSGFPLSRQFGLGEGFEHYDDDFGAGEVERGAGETARRVLAYLEGAKEKPLFLWVHFYDPHEPYEAPEPFRSAYPENPYLAEVAYMDQHLGEVLKKFEALFSHSPRKILVVGDHGESLGEHGEALHGNLLYQGALRVPLILVGGEIPVGRLHRVVSVRRVFHTILGWAGLEDGKGLADGSPEVVLAEAMKPFLQYGWQPQVAAVMGDLKVIRSGDLEVFDLAADPAEAHDLFGSVEPARALLRALKEYPLPGASQAPDSEALPSQEDRDRLASLGGQVFAG